MKITIEQYGCEYSVNLKDKVEYINNEMIDNTTSDDALKIFVKLMNLAGFNMDENIIEYE